MTHKVDITKSLQIKLKEDSFIYYDVEVVYKAPPTCNVSGWMVVKSPTLIPFIFDFPYDTRDKGYSANGSVAYLSNKELQWYSVYTDSLGKPELAPHPSFYSKEECKKQINNNTIGSNCLGFINTKTGETLWV